MVLQPGCSHGGWNCFPGQMKGASCFGLLLLFFQEVALSLTLTSSAFVHEGSIPSLYTCEGKDILPPLSWTDLPEDIQSLELIVDDPDAPDPAAPKMTWVHWVLYNIPTTAASQPEDVRSRDLPDGTKEGPSNWHRTGYGGPCPPIGRHRYFHKLYALDSVLSLSGQSDKDQVVAAMEGHVLEEAVLLGTYLKGE